MVEAVAVNAKLPNESDLSSLTGYSRERVPQCKCTRFETPRRQGTCARARRDKVRGSPSSHGPWEQYRSTEYGTVQRETLTLYHTTRLDALCARMCAESGERDVQNSFAHDDGVGAPSTKERSMAFLEYPLHTAGHTQL